MNRLTVPCIFVLLLAGTGVIAHAQPAANLDAQPSHAHPIAEPVIYCTQQTAATALPQACEVRQPDAVTHPASIVTRREIECVLSGKCEVAERSRIHF